MGVAPSHVRALALCVICAPSLSFPVALPAASRPRLPRRRPAQAVEGVQLRPQPHGCPCRPAGVRALRGAALQFALDAYGRERLCYSEDGFETWRHTLSGRDGTPRGVPQTVRVNYIQHGTAGTPVVLVHGFGASGFHWRYQIAELGKHHRVYALDLLGFGLSDKPNITYSNEYWGQQVSSFIREVVGEPATVVGNSLGCIIALSAASRDPSLARALVLINSPGNFAQGPPPPATPALPLPLDQLLEGPGKRVVAQGTKTLRRLYRLASAAAIAVSSESRLRALGGSAVLAKAARGGDEGWRGWGMQAGEREYLFVADDVRRAFALLDADGSGLIDVGELQDAMLALGFQVDEPELSSMMREIDADGSGTIDFEEFVAIARRMEEHEAARQGKRSGGVQAEWLPDKGAVTAWQLLVLVLVLPTLTAPEVARRLVQAQPLLLSAVEQQQKILEGLLRKLSNGVLEATRQQVPILLESIYTNAHQVDADLIRSVQQPAEDPEASEAFYRICAYALRNIGHPSASPLLQSLPPSMPLGVIWGADDKFLDFSIARDISDACAARQQPCRLVKVERASHCAHDDDPDTVSRELRLFLQEFGDIRDQAALGR